MYYAVLYYIVYSTAVSQQQIIGLKLLILGISYFMKIQINGQEMDSSHKTILSRKLRVHYIQYNRHLEFPLLIWK